MKRKPIATQMDPKLAEALKKYADERGLKIYAVIEEAVSDYLKKGK